MTVIETRKYLSPGQVIVTDEDTPIWTLLGSCISIIFYHRASHLTGVSHAQLPNPSTEENCFEKCPDPCYRENSNQNKFVTCSTRYMYNEFISKNILPHNIEVYLIGGSSVINIQIDGKSAVGFKNIEAAKKILSTLKLKITEENTGGKSPRTLQFAPSTGKLTVNISK